MSGQGEHGPDPRDVAAALFVASGASVRSFEKTAEIDAPAPEVFRAWTDAVAWKRVYGPDRDELRANIELAIGGWYEWLFDGKVGSNGCQVLSYIPDRMISFSWNAPPTQPETRAKRTWVVVELEPIGGARTRVRLTHLGFGEGPRWDETFAYFDDAWDRVLGAMRAAFGAGG